LNECAGRFALWIARPGEPALNLSKGPVARRQPSPVGLGQDIQDFISTGGAALDAGSVAPPALRLYLNLCGRGDS